MCKCTPFIKTPFCGKGDCQWPVQEIPLSPPIGTACETPPAHVVAADPLPGHSTEELLRRAVRNCRDRHSPMRVKHPRWVAVMDTFALGSTYAHELCRRYGLDPDEMVKR